LKALAVPFQGANGPEKQDTEDRMHVLPTGLLQTRSGILVKTKEGHEVNNEYNFENAIILDITT
jgi:hypothetical protein